MAGDEFLSVRDVTVRFGGLTALSGLSFDMREGSIRGLIGPNGAGKSTLFNVIAGLLPPTEGEIFFGGNSIQREPRHKRVHLGIARTFQNLQIFGDLTVLENVMVGCHSRFRSGFVASMLRTRRQQREEHEIREIAMHMLEQTHLASVADVPAASLSFGQAKILEIARALAAAPKLLMLDEPVAGVPHAEVGHMAEVIRNINAAGVSVLLVEHNMSFVMGLCHEIVVLNYGRKIADDKAAQVRRDPAVLEAYLGEDPADA